MLSDRSPVLAVQTLVTKTHQPRIFPLPSHHQTRPRPFFATATSNPRLPTILVALPLFAVHSTLEEQEYSLLHFHSCQDIAFISCHDSRNSELNRDIKVSGDNRKGGRLSRHNVGTVCTLVTTSMDTTTTDPSTSIYSLLCSNSSFLCLCALHVTAASDPNRSLRPTIPARPP